MRHSRRRYLGLIGAATASGVAGCSGLDSAQRLLPKNAGDTKWVFNTGNNDTLSPTVVDETVYVGSTNGSLYAVESGSQQWEFETAGAIESVPVVDSGTVYVGDSTAMLYAVDATTGEKNWECNVGSPVLSSPAVGSGTVYVGADRLYAVNAAKGNLEWAFAGDDNISSSPIFSGDIYVGSTGGHLYKINTSGEKQWTFDTQGQVVPAIVNEEEGIVGRTDS